MKEPVIISSYDPGIHNANLDQTISRLDKEVAWTDLSCVMITPCGPPIAPKVVAAWESMLTPPNNRFCRLMAVHMEVGQAYSNCIDAILAHPELSTWKYICTREHDNAMPADGLVQLLRQMEAHPEFAVIGGLYFTKGPGGCAQIWGDPHDFPLNFRPQKPDPNGGLKECNGTGMGFTVFRLSMFKDSRLRKPWFKTPQLKMGDKPEEGAWTQDLYFWSDAHKHGYRCAIDCSVKVGHWDDNSQIMW